MALIISSPDALSLSQNLKKIIGALIAFVAAIVIGVLNGASELIASDSNCKAQLSLGEHIEWNTVRQEVVR